MKKIKKEQMNVTFHIIRHAYDISHGVFDNIRCKNGTCRRANLSTDKRQRVKVLTTCVRLQIVWRGFESHRRGITFAYWRFALSYYIIIIYTYMCISILLIHIYVQYVAFYDMLFGFSRDILVPEIDSEFQFILMFVWAWYWIWVKLYGELERERFT